MKLGGSTFLELGDPHNVIEESVVLLFILLIELLECLNPLDLFI